MPSCALVCVVHGTTYERYCQQLFDSAWKFFRPVEQKHLQFHMLPGRSGWPAATIFRYEVLSGALKDGEIKADYLYLCDADMRFEAQVGPEILGDLVATLHPGYVTTPPDELPYERRPESVAHVPMGRGSRYYAGGFIGGSYQQFGGFVTAISDAIRRDAVYGVTARWHDESHINAALNSWREPDVVLSPAYCHPDSDAWYQSIWAEPYERKLVALDKTRDERGER